jgi:hypothetical protein
LLFTRREGKINLMDNMTRIDDLAKAGTLPKRELVELLSSYSEADRIYAAEKALPSLYFAKRYFQGVL